MISDVIVLYVLKKRKFYKENKYQQVIDTDDNDYEIINNPPDVENPVTVSLLPLKTHTHSTVYSVHIR